VVRWSALSVQLAAYLLTRSLRGPVSPPTTRALIKLLGYCGEGQWSIGHRFLCHSLFFFLLAFVLHRGPAKVFDF
jgi:hypothetical protein